MLNLFIIAIDLMFYYLVFKRDLIISHTHHLSQHGARQISTKCELRMRGKAGAW